VATPAVIVVVSVALLTLVALGATVAALLAHLRRLSTTLGRMREELDPTLQALAADAEVTRAELERVSDAAARIPDSREGGR
jgi:L-aminopeptidase/D-esterase-like protein